MDNDYKYYYWCSGNDSVGIVKATSAKEAEHKVFMSRGIHTTISILEDENFDGYDVAVLVL